jgi:hypothetical protein
LSYAWGKGYIENKAIILNGCKFNVSATLDNALQHIRQHRKSLAVDHLWIDAICINQSDTPEKSEQVVHMKEIYENACQVIVWLGDERSGTTKLAATLLENHIKVVPPDEFQKVVQGTISVPEGTKITAISGFGAVSVTVPPAGAWEAFGSDLMKRDWWKRMWVIQEIVAAWHIPVTVMCGPYIFSWASLELAYLYAEASSLQIIPHNQEDYATGSVYLPNVRWKAAYRRRLALGQELPILEMMANNVSCEATDPRDKIYSLLGLATDIESVSVSNEKRFVQSHLCLLEDMLNNHCQN